MPTVTAYPQNITQTTGGKYRPFDNLNNLKNNQNTIAKSNGHITGKNGSTPTPSTLTCTNFKFNLPTGARINQITVEINQQKLDYLQNKYPNLPAPTIIILGTNITVNKTGATPTKNMTATTHRWHEKDYKHQIATYNQINSTQFGVQIRYPANTNNYEGWLQLRFIRIHVQYMSPKFSLTLNRADNEDLYVGKKFDINLNLSNLVDKVTYRETATINLPSCLSLYNYQGEQITVQDNTITWRPQQYRSNNQLTLTLYCESIATGSITANTGLTPTDTKTISVSIGPTPVPVVDETTFDTETTYYCKTDVEFDLTIHKPSIITEGNIWIQPDKALKIEEEGTWTTVSANTKYSMSVDRFTDDTLTLNCKSSVTGITGILIGTGNDTPEAPTYILKVIPASYQYPSLNIFQVTGEELNRLGHGLNYTVQAMLRINCDVEDVDEFVDYYRNFRIGVYNDEVPSGVTVSNYIFDHTRTWSTTPSIFNEYENKEVTFTYDENKPLYIIVTSEFITTNPTDFSLSYSTPALIETSAYHEYEAPGNYPEPINYTLDTDEYSSIDIENLENSTPIVFYNFPFNEGFGTGDDYAIRGVQFEADIVSDNRCVALMKLRHPNGETGEKSIIIESGDAEHIQVGQNYDTWGFKIGELEELEDWEFQFELQNVFTSTSTSANIQIKNATLTVYFMEVPDDVTYCTVDGEDGRHYGVFLEDVDIPFGLNTDTKYYNLDGIDLNDAYRQNIDKKEITLTFQIFGCTFTETTQHLKQIAKLFVNRRDKLNKPIPKIIQFSHLPDEHFEYIMTDPIDTQVEGTDYSPKLKLTIPDGTSWANEDSVTNYIGSNDGIAKVSPIIQVVPLSTTVDIEESESGQKMSINYSGLSSSQVLEINCNNRQVLLKSQEDASEFLDITEYVDFDSDWFSLEAGEFVFNAGSTGIIQSVTITQRG